MPGADAGQYGKLHKQGSIRAGRSYWAQPGSISTPLLHLHCNLPPLQATKLGNSAGVPLGLARTAFSSSAVLASRPSCIVRKAEYQGRPVAVKQAKIGTARDLEYFRKEVFLLCQLAHPNITALLAARLLPPGVLLGCAMHCNDMLETG